MLIYCGAVIFVTKPESFAFSAIFGDVDNVVTVPTSEQREAQAKADREAISAEILTVSAQKADMAEKQAVAAAEKQTDQAIRTAMQTYETGLQQMISDAVAEAYANAADISEEVEAAIPGIVDPGTKNIEAGIDYYIPQILDAVIPEVLTHEGELAVMLYEKYGQTLVDIVYEKVSEMFAAQMVEEEPAPMSQQEYEEARKAVRDAEINGLLSQLQD